MKIIAGHFRGKHILSNKNIPFRPTSSRIKKTIFDIISYHFRSYLVNTNWLDIFAGSGSISLEAISRGAKHVTTVEEDHRLNTIIAKNIENIHAVSNHHKIHKSFLDTTNKDFINIGYDVVFLDPPYYKQLMISSINHLLTLNIMNKKALIIIEQPQKYASHIDGLDKVISILTKQIGKTQINFLQVKI